MTLQAFPSPASISSHLVRAFLVAAAVLALASPAPAVEALLDLRFDDPEKLLVDMENTTRLSAGFAAPKATLASGTGGRATLQIITKNDKKAVDAQGFSAINSPAPGMRIRLDATSACEELGLTIHADESWDIATKKDTHHAFNGGMDFFIRMTSDGASGPGFTLWNWIGPLTLTLRVPKPEDGVMVRASVAEGALKIPEESEARKSVSANSETPISFAPGEIMHVALVFHTNDEGMTTIRAHLQQGTGAMEANDTTLNATVGPFLLPTAAPSEAKARFSFKLSNKGEAQSLDIFRFRVFNEAPEVFPGLE